jgi:hypothetical protein
VPAAVATLATLAVATTSPARAAGPGPLEGVSVLSIIEHTPAWVWLVFAGLIWIGLGRTRDREVGLRGLILFPSIIIASSIYNNLLGSGLVAAMIAGLGVGALLGLAAGIALERHFGAIRLDRGRLRLKGEWTPLVIVLIVFLTRYVRIVLINIDPAFTLTDGFEFTTAALSGFFAVMMLSRTIMRLRIALA